MGSKKRRRKSGRPFIRLWRNVKRSEAYHGLRHTARAALIELLDRYNGLNNGMLGLGVRQLADELNCSKDTAARALLELDDAGLAPETQDRSKVSPVRHKTAKFERGLCQPCHNRKTAKERSGRQPMLHDQHGMPMSPDHHWNQR